MNNYYSDSINFIYTNYNYNKIKSNCTYGALEQDPNEWNLFCNYIKNNYKINYGLEIGSFCGGTLHSLCQIAEDNATIISIDNFSYVNKKIFETREKRNELFNKFKKPNQKLHLIIGDSKAFSIIKKIENILSNNKLDYLFIDGDHSYRGVQSDFLNYRTFMRNKKSIIGFHAYTTTPEITKYLNEIKIINKKFDLKFLTSPVSNLVYMEL